MKLLILIGVAMINGKLWKIMTEVSQEFGDSDETRSRAQV